MSPSNSVHSADGIAARGRQWCQLRCPRRSRPASDSGAKHDVARTLAALGAQIPDALGARLNTKAAGPTHAMAIDESSALYSWGRTFEGQAAQPSNMGVVLAPRLVRFTSENPVVAVA